MLFRSFTAFLLFVSGAFTVDATQCADVFSGSHSLSANGGTVISSGNACNSGSCSPIPTFSLVTPFPTLSPLGSFNSNSLIDGSFEYTDWGLAKDNVISFSGTGTAVLYFDGSITIPKNTQINSGGSAANVMIIVNGALSIAKDADINAFIYASGSISLAKDSNYNGAISAGGALVSDKDNTFTFSPSDVDELDSEGFCESNIITVVPLAEYRFDKTSYDGSVDEVVDSIGGFNGQSISAQPIEGKVCNAIDFSADGTSDYVILDESILSSKTDFTVSLWAQTSNNSNQSLLSGANSSTDNELIMWLSNGSSFRPYLKGSHNGDVAITSINDSNWHHLVWTRSGKENCLYRDNIFQGCKTLSSSSLNIESLILGQEQDNVGGGFSSSQDWEGLIDELLVYDSAISDDEISDIYNNQNAGLGYDGSTRTCEVIPPLEPQIAIAEFRFDERSYSESADEVVDSIGDFHGITSQVQPDEGLLCNAADLSATGTSDFITLDSAVLSGKDDFTISVWGKTGKTSNQGILSGAESGSINELIMWFSSGTQFTPFLKNTNVGSVTISAISDDDWHHLVWTRDGTQNCLYIDKVSQGCKTLSSSTLSIDSLILGQEQDSLGGSFDSDQAWDGLLDELLIFDAVIPESQIEEIYDNQIGGLGYDGSVRTCPSISLLANFQMDKVNWDGSLAEVVDETGNFNSTAVNGATTDGALPALSTNPGTCRYGSFNDNYVALPDSFENLQGSFTITAWINPSNLNSGSRIFADDEFNQTGYAFSLGDPGNGKLRFYSRGVSPISVDTTTSIIANEWTFVTAVHDSDNKTRQIYINGEPQIVTGGGTSNTYSGTWGTDTGVATIGGETDAGESGNRFTGSIDEVRVYEGALSESEIVAVFAETHPCETIHHFEINHDAEGLTCIAEPLTIKACSDAACTNTIATPTDVQIFANGVLKTTVTVTGETETEFNHLVEEPITLSSDQPYTCNSGSDTSCDISFVNAGFVLDVNSGSDVSSCESVNFEIKAVKLSDSGVSCAPAFTGGQALDFSFNYSNPTVGTKLPLLNATSMATAGQIETRTIVFDANGEATLPIEYDDAGTLSFTLSENVSSGVTSSTISKDFYPSKIVVTAKKEDGVLLNNATSSGDPKQVAGGDFNLSFSGQCSDNTETLNYQPQSSTDIELAIRHILPSSVTSVLGALTVEGTLINATESANTDWQSINTREKELVASYSEVGVISINIKDTDYLGNELNTLGFINVGRFYPSYFEVSIDHGSFQNASSLDATPFTYVGMPLGYSYAPILTIRAKNYAGETTQNYTETSFQKLTEANVIRLFPSADTTKNGVDTITKMVVESTPVDGVISKLSNGVMDYTFSNADTYTYSKDANSEVSEFTVSYDILIDSITDSDQVGINSSTNILVSVTELPLTVQPTEGVQRFGRLVLENSFGSENSSLAQSFEVEFLNTSGDYQRNSDDDFSVIISDDASWSFTNSTDDIVISDLLLSGSDGSFSGGQLKNIELSSGGNQGAIDIEYTTPAWLQYNWSGKASNLHDEDANATATFGVYRGNDRIISWREVGN